MQYYCNECGNEVDAEDGFCEDHPEARVVCVVSSVVSSPNVPTPGAQPVKPTGPEPFPEPLWLITNVVSGLCLGLWGGETPSVALDRLSEAMGDLDFADACETVGITPDQQRAELSVREVDPEDLAVARELARLELALSAACAAAVDPATDPATDQAHKAYWTAHAEANDAARHLAAYIEVTT